MSIEFVNELPGGEGSTRDGKLRAFADGLRANPGRWAKYPAQVSGSSLHSRAYQIRNGSLAAFREGTFKAAVREGVLYVQHVGEAV